MRFAEVFLRLGSSLVAWMILYAYVLWLAALHSIGCGPDGDAMHRLLLGMAPVAGGFAFLLRATRPFGEIHSILRWLSVPLVLLSPFTLMSVWKTFVRANLDSMSICSNTEATLWQQIWAPIQIVTLVLIAYLLLQMLKTSSHNKHKGI